MSASCVLDSVSRVVVDLTSMSNAWRMTGLVVPVCNVAFLASALARATGSSEVA